LNNDNCVSYFIYIYIQNFINDIYQCVFFYATFNIYSGGLSFLAYNLELFKLQASAFVTKGFRFIVLRRGRVIFFVNLIPFLPSYFNLRFLKAPSALGKVGLSWISLVSYIHIHTDRDCHTSHPRLNSQSKSRR